jgi:hypothetical protein
MGTGLDYCIDDVEIVFVTQRRLDRFVQDADLTAVMIHRLHYVSAMTVGE